MAQPSPSTLTDLVLPDGPVSEWPAKTMVVIARRVVITADKTSDSPVPWAPMDDTVNLRFSHDDVTAMIHDGWAVHVHPDGLAPVPLAPPADGWADGDWVVIANGLIAYRDGGDRLPWVLECTPRPRYVDHEISNLVLAGRAVYVHAPREPQPLPTEPGSVISATVQTEDGRAQAVLIRSRHGVWRGIEPVLGWTGFEPESIVAFESLLTHTQWALRAPRD